LPPRWLNGAAATEIMPMAEANSLLIRCENSRRSSRASNEGGSFDGLSVICIMLHPIEAGLFSPTNRRPDARRGIGRANHFIALTF
jgi:hypothetical protein